MARMADGFGISSFGILSASVLMRIAASRNLPIASQQTRSEAPPDVSNMGLERSFRKRVKCPAISAAAIRGVTKSSASGRRGCGLVNGR